MRAAETMHGMKPPTINLARRPFRNNTMHYTVFIACGVLLAIATIINVREYYLRGTELTILRDQLTTGRQRYDKLFHDVETMKREISQVNLELLNDKSAFVNGLILSRLFSWSQLFERLEELIPYDVKVRSVRPSISAKEIEIQIDGMAKSAMDLYEFEANLADSEYFAGVYPTNESTRESKTELNFDLIMKYLPAGKSKQDPSPPTPTASLPQPETQEEGEEDAGAAVDDPATEKAGEAGGTAPEGEPGAKPEAAADAAQRPPQAGSGEKADAALHPPQAGSGAAPAGAAAVAPPATAQGAPPAAAPGQTEIAPAPPAAPAGPMMKMSNKEFFDQRGEERFIKVRGNLVPQTADDHPDLNNAEYIERFGVEQFMTRRGSLNVMQQKPKPVPPVAP